MSNDYKEGPRSEPWEYTTDDNWLFVSRRGYNERQHTDTPPEILYSSDDLADRSTFRYLVARLNRLDALEVALTRLADAVEAERATRLAGHGYHWRNTNESLVAAEQAAREVLR